MTNSPYRTKEIEQGIYQISDVMDNRAYVVAGSHSAVLVDTCVGYGDIRPVVRNLTGLPVTVLLTHSHYDHVGGMDDIRPYCQFGEINVYADPIAREGMLQMLPYCFAEHRYPGVPAIGLHEIHAGEGFRIGDIDVMPVRVMHGRLPILGYRFGCFAYITDMKTIDDDQLPLLQGVDTLVVNALRFDNPHHSHQLVADAVQFARRVGARRTLLTHVCHDIGLHDEVNRRLPEGVELAYDGQRLIV
jgi:phosphoribosyl 1,2-cyclic phosphate phosphodiesterase